MLTIKAVNALKELGCYTVPDAGEILKAQLIQSKKLFKKQQQNYKYGIFYDLIKNVRKRESYTFKKARIFKYRP